MKQNFVIALGGSIMHPDEINVEYIKQFRDFICEEIAQDKRFIIIVGGGALCRKFNKAAQELATPNKEDLDWLGIAATRVNAQLIRIAFGDKANPTLFEKRGQIKEFGKYSIIVGSGWTPGWSTDYVAIQIAADLGVKQVIILGKPDHIYNKDNQKFHDAKHYETITWEEYFKLVPTEWDPGLHAPIDPIAARLAQKEKVEVIVAGGQDLKNIKNIIDGREFEGTTVKNN